MWHHRPVRERINSYIYNDGGNSYSYETNKIYAYLLSCPETSYRRNENQEKWNVKMSNIYFLKDNIKWHDDPMVHGPGEGNCKIHKCLTLITEIHKLKKKTFKQDLHVKMGKRYRMAMIRRKKY